MQSFRSELEFAQRQFLVDRIVIQVFKLASPQVAIEALPEAMQFGDEGLQLLLHGLTEPGDIQTLECFLCSFRGHQFVAKAAAANAIVEVQFAHFQALAYLTIDPELVTVAAQAGRCIVRAEFQKVRAQALRDGIFGISRSGRCASGCCRAKMLFIQRRAASHGLGVARLEKSSSVTSGRRCFLNRTARWSPPANADRSG